MQPPYLAANEWLPMLHTCEPNAWVTLLDNNTDSISLLVGARSCDGLTHRSVMTAAARNVSIKKLRIQTSGMTFPKLDNLSCMVTRLRGVQRLSIFPGNRRRNVVSSAIVDQLLNTSANASFILTELELYLSGGPLAFIRLSERFQTTLTTLTLGDSSDGIILREDFVTAIIHSIEHGYLRSLRAICIHCHSAPPTDKALVAALRSTNVQVKQCTFYMCPGNKTILSDIATLCVTSKTISTIAVRRAMRVDGEIDMMRLLCCGATPDLAFAPTLTSLYLEGLSLCPPPTAHPQTWARLAGQTLRNIQHLHLWSCRIPELHVLLSCMPVLITLAVLNRDDYVHRDFDAHDNAVTSFNLLHDPTMIRDDIQLHNLVTQLTTSLANVSILELDLVACHNFSFPTIGLLLRECQGAVYLNLGNHPWASAEHIRDGLANISSRIVRLGLRFHDCAFGDDDLEYILRPLVTTQSLSELELGIRGTAELGLLPELCAMLAQLLHSNKRLSRLTVRAHNLPAFEQHFLHEAIPILSHHNCALRHLDVSNIEPNDPRYNLLSALREMLDTNHSLHKITGIPFQEKNALCTEIRHVLDLNLYGRQLLRNEIPSSLWTPILANIAQSKKPALMFHFLRNMPRVTGGVRGTKRHHPSSNYKSCSV